MLSFLRRFVASPIGAGFFGLILVAFVVTLYDSKTMSMFGGGGAAFGDNGAVATIGAQKITQEELRRAVQREFEVAQRNQPGVTMAALVAGGGVEGALDRLMTDKALVQFGAQQDLVVSDRLMGSAMGRVAAFMGPSGKFDDRAYRAALANAKYTDAEARAEFRTVELSGFFAKPAGLAVKAPMQLARPYAALQLEARRGVIGTVPAAAFGTLPPPSDAALSTFYSRNVARYTLPERRIVRYAMFDRTRFDGKVAPTEAEIAAFYKTNAVTFQASEKRGLTQIVVADPAHAAALLGKIKAGMPMAAAAASAGLTARTLVPQDRASFEKLSGPAVAQAVFTAARGSIAPLAKSGLGTHIVRIDAVVTTAARSLAEARTTIVPQLTQQKTDDALTNFIEAIDNDTAGGATFDEITKKHALTAMTTPAVTASGNDPAVPSYRAPPEIGAILRDAFKANPDDEPAVVQLSEARNFAVWKLDKIVPTAPRALSAIRDQVLADARRDAAAKAAHKLADTIATAINNGTPIAQAMAASGVQLPPPAPIGATRQQVIQARDKAPPPLVMMFAMPEKRARVSPAPDQQGWYVVYLDKIARGDVAMIPPVLQQTQPQLSQLLATEYRSQLIAAVKTALGSTRDAAALARLKQALTGSAAAQ